VAVLLGCSNSTEIVAMSGNKDRLIELKRW
jgi:hypothetical protein